MNRIESKIRAEGLREISSEAIGEYVMNELAEVDDVAYIRFASVYREFKDINVFMQEMQSIGEKRDEISKDHDTDIEENH